MNHPEDTAYILYKDEQLYFMPYDELYAMDYQQFINKGFSEIPTVEPERINEVFYLRLDSSMFGDWPFDYIDMDEPPEEFLALLALL